MSLIFITDHDEVIYDAVLSREKDKQIKPKYKNHLDLKYVDPAAKNIIKKCYATMGPAEYLPPDPTNYLRRKSQKGARIEKPQKFERHCTKHEKYAPLEQTGTKLMHNDINFIRENVKTMKEAKPREPEQKLVITRNGDKVDSTRLEPRFIYLKNFGKAPHYVLKRVKQMGSIMQSIKDKDNLKDLPNCRYITRPERENLLDGLKKNWDEIQKEYQLLPIITDTIPKRNRKVGLENSLKALEKDILLIEQHPYIYVIDE